MLLMDLQQTKELFDRGQYQEVLDCLASLNDYKQGSSFDEWLEYSIFKSRSLERLGRNEEALKLTKKVKAQPYSPSDPALMLGLYVAIKWPLLKLGRFKEAEKINEEGFRFFSGLSDAQKKNRAYWTASYLNIKAALACSLGRISYTTLEVYFEGLVFAELDGSLDLITTLLHNIGVLYQHIGEIPKAIEYYKRCLEVDEKVGNPLGTALLYLNLGGLYRQLGKLELSEAYLKRGLTSANLIGNKEIISACYFQLILTSLEEGDQSQAQIYSKDLQNLFNQTLNKSTEILMRLAEALILKDSPRALKKFQAQEILTEIVNKEKKLEYSQKILTMTHLCELLLIEYRSFSQPEIFSELKKLIQEFNDLAQFSQSFVFKVENLVIQARFALLEGDFQKALRFMDQAAIMTEQKGFELLRRKIELEKELFETDYEKQVNLVQSTSALHKHLELTRIEKYMREAQKTTELFR